MVLPRKTVVSNADKILTQTPIYQRDTTKDYKHVVSDINEVLRKKVEIKSLRGLLLLEVLQISCHHFSTRKFPKASKNTLLFSIKGNALVSNNLINGQD